MRNPNAAECRTYELLEAIRADFPRRKRSMERAKRGWGDTEPYEERIDPPEPVAAVPTFRLGVTRPLTPMLAARFRYAASWHHGIEVWLGVGEMARVMRTRTVLSYHRSMREHQEGSAPMLFPDDRLSLLAFVPDEPTALEYLVWARDGEEPEVWTYSGMSSNSFQNLDQRLEAYLRWDRA
jgi:hypothetical protein